MLLFVTTPEQFDVKYHINPWMVKSLKRNHQHVINHYKAFNQFNNLLHLLRKYATINLIPVNGLDPRAALPDIIYTADAAVFLPNLPKPTAIMARMSKAHRRPEEEAWSSYMKTLPIRTIELPSKHGLYFEGSGEAIFSPDFKKIFCGYGIRSSLEGIHALIVAIEEEYRRCNSIDKKPNFYPIRLINSKYFHLDLCFRPLHNCALIRRNAIAKHSIKLIEAIYGKDNLIDVGDDEPFACNGIIVDNHYLCSSSILDKTIRKIEKLSKMKVSTILLSEFEKGGGSLKCMILPLH